MELLIIPIFLVLVLALIFIFYLVPLDLTFTGAVGERETDARITAIWGFIGLRSTLQKGTPCFEILVVGHTAMQWRSRPGREIRIAPKKQGKIRFRAGLNAIQVFWPKILRMLILLRSSISLKYLDCEVTYGLGNPVSTGLLYGFYCAMVLPMVPYGNSVSIRVNPVFDRETIRGLLHFKLRIHRPFRLGIIAAALLLKKDSRDTLKTLLSGGTP